MTKNKKTLKYLSVRGLRVGLSHLVWQDLRTVSAVRKGDTNRSLSASVK